MQAVLTFSEALTLAQATGAKIAREGLERQRPVRAAGVRR